MADRVIQGFFPGGRPVVQPQGAAPARHAPPPVPQARPAPGPARVGPPPPAGAPRPAQPKAPQHRPAAAVQRQSGGFAVDPAVLRTTGPGRPLPDGVRAQMESALGADFSAVRVHVGPQAESIGALAFTTGTDIYFAPGRYQPDSAEGRRLLGHELAHVVQQRQGRVRGGAGAVTVVQDAALEAEADRAGVKASAGGFSRSAEGLRTAAPQKSIQRKVVINGIRDYDKNEVIVNFQYDRDGSPGGNHFVSDHLTGRMIGELINGKTREKAIDAIVEFYMTGGFPGSVTRPDPKNNADYDYFINNMIKAISDRPDNRFEGKGTGDNGGLSLDVPATDSNMSRVSKHGERLKKAILNIPKSSRGETTAFILKALTEVL